MIKAEKKKIELFVLIRRGKYFLTGFEIVFLLKPRCFACGNVYVCNKSSFGTKTAHSDRLFDVDVSIPADFTLFEYKII
jgi:hypothetical protein